jgi:putative membrane protein
MPHTHHAAFETFLVSAALILAALVYVRGWIRTRKLDLDTGTGWRALSFLLGLFFIWLALVSPLAALDHELLTVHMVQHLLLMTLAPPFIWLGAPVKPLLRGLPQPFVEAFIVPFSRLTLMKRLGTTPANLALCWLAAAGVLVGWHIPALFMLGLQSGVWHGIQQASFLITGLLFWWPVIQPASKNSNRSEWSILLYLFLATLPCDILSGFLVFCDRVVYPVYFSSTQTFGLSALADQECAGALMWTCVTVVYLVAGTIFAERLLSPGRSRPYLVVKSDPQRATTPQTVRRRLEVV